MHLTESEGVMETVSHTVLQLPHHLTEAEADQLLVADCAERGPAWDLKLSAGWLHG